MGCLRAVSHRLRIRKPGAEPEALEDLVYRATLAESDRAIRKAGPWLTIPTTLALLALVAGLGVLLGRAVRPPREAPRSVAVVLQEGPEPRAAARAGPPPPRAAPAAAPNPAAPPADPLALPMVPVPEAVPDAPPVGLPTEDLSRHYGIGAGGAPGGAPGGTGPGGGGGEGEGAGGGRAPRIVDLDITQVRERHRPPLPDYPPRALMARIQGTVVVRITVGLDGVPLSAQALEGPVQLRAAAEAYAMAWRFDPYLQNGVAQVSRFSLTVVYRLK